MLDPAPTFFLVFEFEVGVVLVGDRFVRGSQYPISVVRLAYDGVLCGFDRSVFFD
ncbi:hypothetical protein [Haladaptatus sp. CMAA 1911]|uniref:hypothetical protein n=1 Tax=unclassified Haladaptatus TaxID=2622732 RepID=UPI0037546167